MKQGQNESVFRAFAIIEYLAESEDWVSLRALARDLGLMPATAYRFLSSLKSLGYVQQHPEDSRYQLTLKFASIAARVLERTQLRRIARPYMERLTAVSNETTHLAVLEDNQIVYIDKVDNLQAMKMRSRVGTRGFIHSTAVGKSMVAFLPKEERERILGRVTLPPLTKNTLTDPEEFTRRLEKVRARGYAVDDEENELGIRCVGAPLFDHVGRVAGAVSVSGWTITMTHERLPELAQVLQETCRAISRELGYSAGAEPAGPAAPEKPFAATPRGAGRRRPATTARPRG
jgi:IclR family acetate operon transcriptional repressor